MHGFHSSSNYSHFFRTRAHSKYAREARRCHALTQPLVSGLRRESFAPFAPSPNTYSSNLRVLMAMQKQGIKFDRLEKSIGRCQCRVSWREDKKFITKPQLYSIIPHDERYPRCSECLKFYMEDDWLQRFTHEEEENERHRHKMMKSGHPHYQPGAKFAPRREEVDVTGLQQN